MCQNQVLSQDYICAVTERIVIESYDFIIILLTDKTYFFDNAYA